MNMDFLDFQLELESVLDALEHQLIHISNDAKRLGVSPHVMKDGLGRSMLMDPLIAKSQVLIALYNMSKESNDTRTQAPPDQG